VLDIDRDRQRISLGLKQTQKDPWQQVFENRQVNEIVHGRVTKLVSFGAFVEIEEGVEGLIHISQLAWEHTERTEDVVNVGDEVQVKVVEVDPMGKIRLSRKALLPRPPGAGRDTGEGHGPPPRPSGPPRREGGGPPREHDRPRRDDNDEGGAKPYFRERRGRS
jgi:small subunit ribosomal protein S1